MARAEARGHGRARSGILPALLFLLALAVRLYNLTYHSLWFDEVVSTVWAGRPAGEIWRVGLALVEDKHPPLYYLLLHGWTALFGPGDSAVRGLGALAGAAAVLPAYAIGCRLGGRRAGLLGAVLLALNPFLVWYSQEARMFMPATTFILVGMWGTLGIGDWGLGAGRRPRIPRLLLPWLACVLGFTAALYSYLFSAFMLPVAAAWLAIGWWAARGQPAARAGLAAGASALLAVALLFLPLASSAWLVSGAESAPGRAFAGMWPAVRDLLRIYAFGWPQWPAPWPAVATAGAALLLTPGLLARADSVGHASGGVTEHPARGDAPVGDTRGMAGSHAGGVTYDVTRADPVGHAGGVTPHPARGDALAGEARGRAGSHAGGVAYDMGQGHAGQKAHGGALLFAWLAVPILIGGLLLARDHTVFAESRYFIFLAPALCLGWGRGIAALIEMGARLRGGRVFAGVGYAAAAGLVVVTLVALRSDWIPANRREAWREAAAFVAAQAGPRDAILVQADYVHPAFQRYFKGPQLVFFPFTGPLNDPAQVDPPLAGLAAFDAVWVVQSHNQDVDPGNLVLGWFGARFPLITEAFPQGIAIHGYTQRYRTPELPPGTQPVDAALGNMRLLAYSGGPRALSPRDDVYHPPSNWIHVTTYWAPANGAAAAAKQLTIRLVDAAGRVWGESLARPNDALHIWDAARWLPGEVVRADTDVNLNPATPPGAYRLVVQAEGVEGSADLGQITVLR